MKKILYIIIFISTMTCLNGCIKTIDFNGEETAPLVVVNGHLQADSVAKIQVSKSHFFLDSPTTEYHGEDAIVELYINNEYTETLVLTIDTIEVDGYYDDYYLDYNYYFTGTKILSENDLVRVEVDVPGFDKVYSEVKIPSKPNVQLGETTITYITYFDYYPFYFTLIDDEWVCTWDTALKPDSIHSFSINAAVILNDPADEHNYYNISLDNVVGINTTSSDIVFNNLGDNAYYFGKNNTFNDILINGKSHKLTFTLNNIWLTENGYYEFGVNVSQTDEGFYQYCKTSESQDNSGLLNLFMEPVQVYSNIVNGVGCLVASSTITDTIIIELK